MRGVSNGLGAAHLEVKPPRTFLMKGSGLDLALAHPNQNVGGISIQSSVFAPTAIKSRASLTFESASLFSSSCPVLILQLMASLLHSYNNHLIEFLKFV